MQRRKAKLIGMTEVEPTEQWRQATVEFLAEFQAAGESTGSDVREEVRKDFAAFVRKRRRWAQGLDQPKDGVPVSTYVLVRRQRVLGAGTLRHRLTEALRDWGGHISYEVRPSERQKGWGTLMLKLMLGKARDLGIDRLLVTCGAGNIASQRVILKNGGVLDSESHSAQAGRVTQRYWIDLAKLGTRTARSPENRSP